jgi:hypothetical protein
MRSTVSAANPTVRLFTNLPTFIKPSGHVDAERSNFVRAA